MPLSILIAEDSATDRLLLASIVRRLGYQVILASDGLEAVALFLQKRPDLVLMDALMPNLDGLQATRQIKAAAGEVLVPVIFLTSLSESEALMSCLEAGGDDFLPKPYNALALEAKIKAMSRLRMLQATVLRQRDQIAKHHEYLLAEQRVAKAVFDRVAHSGCLSEPHIRYMQSPYALFNGDLLLAAYSPSGDMHVLLGDFTGHGLPAAIGAMPLSDVFYGMTAKGYGIHAILREMNAKLKRILPADMFCCAAMLNISYQREVVEVWNGGLPSGYLRRATGALHSLASRYLPLGILAPEAFDDRCEVLPLSTGDRLYLFSDGVTEAQGVTGKAFSDEGLRQVMMANQAPEHLFYEIQGALEAFYGCSHDDASLLEVTILAEGDTRQRAQDFSQVPPSAEQDWSASFEFRAETLKHFNPLPLLLQLLVEVEGLRPRLGALYSVLGELYSNALEHGVLGLDSAMKDSADGFTLYYQERERRLSLLEEGFVRFHLDLKPSRAGGCLTVRVEDSGIGFDVQAALSQQQGLERLSGHGLSLVNNLADECSWRQDGKSIGVEFYWTLDD